MLIAVRLQDFVFGAVLELVVLAPSWKVLAQDQNGTLDRHSRQEMMMAGSGFWYDAGKLRGDPLPRREFMVRGLAMISMQCRICYKILGLGLFPRSHRNLSAFLIYYSWEKVMSPIAISYYNPLRRLL
ncbi:hypothetical protein BDV95DRAFT_574868, partial [Massariosphaeria phaeospora]